MRLTTEANVGVEGTALAWTFGAVGTPHSGCCGNAKGVTVRAEKAEKETEAPLRTRCGWKQRPVTDTMHSIKRSIKQIDDLS